MAYRDLLVRLGDRTAATAVAVYGRYTAGELTREETIAVLARLIAGANSRAISLADMSLAATLMAELGQPVPVIAGVQQPGELERLTRSATTVLTVAEASEVPDAIIARLARSEPLHAAADAYSSGMKGNRRVKGWTRQRSASCCQLCTWWWREGRVWPAEHPFQHHQGCTCTPKPVVTTKEIKETGYTRSLRNTEGISA